MAESAFARACAVDQFENSARGMLGYKLHEFATRLTNSLLVRRASLLGTAVLARVGSESAGRRAREKTRTRKDSSNVGERGSFVGAAAGLLPPLRTGRHAQRRAGGGATLPAAHGPRQRSPGEP